MNWANERIVVLAGGPSCEREISLISGKAVYEALHGMGLSVFMLDPVGDFLKIMAREKVSMAFIALHGTFGEDGAIQTILENEKIRYTGSGIFASQIAFDKARTQTLLKDKEVSIGRFCVIDNKQDLRPIHSFSRPFVVKPTKAGSSVGVTIVYENCQAEDAILRAFEYSDAVLIEEYIPGRELTVSLLDGKPLPIVEVLPAHKFYDYEAKYMDAGTRYEFPAKLNASETQMINRVALEAYHAIGCEVMSRVDIILSTDGKPYVLEVNTIPGLTNKSLLPKAALCEGIGFEALCMRILELSARLPRSKKIEGLKEAPVMAGHRNQS